MLEITNAFTSSGEVFARAGRAVSEFVQGMVNSDSFRRMQELAEQSFVEAVQRDTPAGRIAEGGVTYDDLVVMQRRINETVQAAAAGSVPHRFMVGTSPEWTLCDDVEASSRRYASGGVVSPPRAPDDDTIPVRISPGEIWCTPDMARRAAPGLLQHLNAPTRTDPTRVELDAIQDGLEELIGWRPAVAHVFALAPADPEITHHDRYLGEGALEPDETSSTHSTDSSGTGAVWSDLMTRIDNLIEVTHRCPIGDANDTPCCGRIIFELPRTDRITEDAEQVTCRGKTAQRQREAAARTSHLNGEE
jgi:hypothetical protein